MLQVQLSRPVARHRASIRSACLDVIRSARIISRAELSERSGLSRSVVSTVVQELLQKGLIREIGIGTSRGGRRPQMLEFVPDARFAIGIAITDGICQGVRTDLNGEVVQRVDIPVDALQMDLLVDAIAEAVCLLAREIEPQKVLGVGVGAPGQIDVVSGFLRGAPGVGRDLDIPLRQMIEQKVRGPVFLVNRSRVGALGEYWRGAGVGVGSECLAFVAVAMHGLAMGLIIEGELFSGCSSLAGELGHVTVVRDGPLCYCGNRGCLETLVCGNAVLALAREKMHAAPYSSPTSTDGHGSDLLTLSVLGEAARAASPWAVETIRETAEFFAVGLGNLINVVNPKVVVLGGTVCTTLGETFIGLVREATRRRCVSGAYAGTQIVGASLGQDAQVIGAATLVLLQVDAAAAP
ncbi:MAG: ROK family transcriptional regulator [Anaerolineae bacterium]|nr:ROK family transcriptional regulator [Anaerolineae bacterium]